MAPPNLSTIFTAAVAVAKNSSPKLSYWLKIIEKLTKYSVLSLLSLLSVTRCFQFLLNKATKMSKKPHLRICLFSTLRWSSSVKFLNSLLHFSANHCCCFLRKKCQKEPKWTVKVSSKLKAFLRCILRDTKLTEIFWGWRPAARVKNCKQVHFGLSSLRSFFCFVFFGGRGVPKIIAQRPN